jgi:hypothetical protein
LRCPAAYPVERKVELDQVEHLLTILLHWLWHPAVVDHLVKQRWREAHKPRSLGAVEAAPWIGSLAAASHGRLLWPVWRPDRINIGCMMVAINMECRKGFVVAQKEPAGYCR